jgi:hypothetical protein
LIICTIFNIIADSIVSKCGGHEMSLEIRPETDYKKLKKYFLSHLPMGVSRKVFLETACLGIARRVVEELGGPEMYRIYWIEDQNTNGKSGFEMHAYVIRAGDTHGSRAYCSFDSLERSVGDVLNKGKDITEEVMAANWNNFNI